MIDFLAILLGDTGEQSARQIFRSVNSTQARIKIMRSLLEESMLNETRENVFDAVIDEFESLTTERNNYAHGLWWTDVDRKVTRSDPSDANYSSFMFAVPVTLKMAQHVLRRINDLEGKVIRLLVAEWRRQDASRPK